MPKILKDFKIISGITREDKHKNLRECLVGVKSGWMENIGEKSGEKTVEVVVWLGGERERGEGERKLVGSWCFLPGPTKNQSSQIGEIIGEKTRSLLLVAFGQIYPSIHYGRLGFWLLFFFFFFFWHFSRRCLLHLSFIINFFLLSFSGRCLLLPPPPFFFLFSFLQFCWFLFLSFLENSFGLIS